MPTQSTRKLLKTVTTWAANNGVPPVVALAVITAATNEFPGVMKVEGEAGVKAIADAADRVWQNPNAARVTAVMCELRATLQRAGSLNLDPADLAGATAFQWGAYSLSLH